LNVVCGDVRVCSAQRKAALPSNFSVIKQMNDMLALSELIGNDGDAAAKKQIAALFLIEAAVSFRFACVRVHTQSRAGAR
jgi:hypothetical protein